MSAPEPIFQKNPPQLLLACQRVATLAIKALFQFNYLLGPKAILVVHPIRDSNATAD